MARGKLRIYVGAAPGVGKTYAMLDEGWRRHERGTDVVIGLVMGHDRPKTIAQIRDVEIIPPKRVTYRDQVWEELDVDAVLARRPQVVLVDELAHTNVPGCPTTKRWEDIELLLAAGIEVISTVNIQHFESLNDVVNQITGVVQRETVPDAVVRRADQIELIDMSPEALRRRMAHGNIYARDKVDAALANYFRVGNLAALRELALLWVADRVEDSLQDYMTHHGLTGPWETRERVVVAITGSPGGDDLIRRAYRMARRSKGDLLGVHVIRDDGRATTPSDLLSHHRALLEEFGGRYHEVVASDIPAALVDFATVQRATQLIIGTTRRSRWIELTRGSIINRVIRLADIDVHVIRTGEVEPSELNVPKVRLWPADQRNRMLVGFGIALCALPLLTFLFAENSAIRPHHGGPVTAAEGFLAYLTVTVVVAAIGGLIPALATATASAAAVDWFLIPPYGTFAIARGSDAVSVLAFVLCAGVVSVVVERAARHRVAALRARSESDAVMSLAHRLAQPNPPQAVLEEIHTGLGRESVALLARHNDEWITEAGIGQMSATSLDESERYQLRTGHTLVMTGRPLRSDEQRLAAALMSYLEAVIAMNHLQGQANAAEELAHTSDLRGALLAAVSHDLRTPLASIKALATTLLEPDVQWSDRDTHEFLATIDAEADRLNKLVDNLLDMSRLQSGALHLARQPVGLDEIIPAALASLSQPSHNIVVEVPETLARVDVDPALLERAVANLVDNALRYCPQDSPVRVCAGEIAGRVDLRIIDEGPGIPVAKRDQLFEPFHRLGDTDNDTGVGLGLAVARGFVEAMDGELTVEDTPGGGITMVVSFPAVPNGQLGPEGADPSSSERPPTIEMVRPT
jgi:two-component system sensor histidine kinase KdpD